jgi:hypothetical protein
MENAYINIEILLEIITMNQNGVVLVSSKIFVGFFNALEENS